MGTCCSAGAAQVAPTTHSPGSRKDARVARYREDGDGEGKAVSAGRPASPHATNDQSPTTKAEAEKPDLLPHPADRAEGLTDTDSGSAIDNLPPVDPAPPRPLDPEEAAARARRQEVMEEVTAPKIIDFGELDIVLDDESPDFGAADADAVIEAFNGDFEERSPEAANHNREPQTQTQTQTPSADPTGPALKPPPAPTAPVPAPADRDEIPTDAWFRDNGLPLPRVTWYQTKDTAYIDISPGECDAGWDVQGNQLRLVAFGAEDCSNADMTFFGDCTSYNFEARGESLAITLTKRVPCFWPQLFRASRKTLAAASWLQRDLAREADDDDQDEETGDEDEETED